MATGKISRLPREIREQLNQRLDAGEPGNRLVAWLNELSAVRGLLAAEFEGAAINEQNLTNWKQGGFREWRMQQEVRAFTQQPAGLAVVTPEQLATIVTARYLAAVREWQQSPMPAERRWRHMRVILQDVMKLQRQGQRAARLELDWERLRFAVERFEAGQQTEARRVMIGFLAAAKEWPEVGTALAAAPRLLQQRKAEREGKESELESIKVDQGEKKLKNEGARNGSAHCPPSPPRGLTRSRSPGPRGLSARPNSFCRFPRQQKSPAGRGGDLGRFWIQESFTIPTTAGPRTEGNRAEREPIKVDQGEIFLSEREGPRRTGGRRGVSECGGHVVVDTVDAAAIILMHGSEPADGKRRQPHPEGCDGFFWSLHDAD